MILGALDMVLRLNSRGPQVTQLQKALVTAGYNPGAIDGIFGPQTDAAVRSFQASAGIRADGIVGTQTMGALQRVVQLPPQEQSASASEEPASAPAQQAHAQVAVTSIWQQPWFLVAIGMAALVYLASQRSVASFSDFEDTTGLDPEDGVIPGKATIVDDEEEEEEEEEDEEEIVEPAKPRRKARSASV